MPTITSQPSTTILHAAYGNSLTYHVNQSFTSGDPLPAIEARIVVNGTLLSTQFFTPSSVSGTTAQFQINVNGIVQAYFRSQYAYPGTFTGYVNMSASSAIATVSVQFFAWIANGDGLLEQNPSSVTSSQSKALNSVQTDLSPFYAASNRRFLTNKPDKVVLKQNEGELLAIYSTVGTPQVVIKTYDFNNALVGTYTKTLSGLGARISIIGVGYPNLQAMAATGWTSAITTGAGDMFDGGTTKYYTIEVRQSGGPTFSEVRTYYLDNSTECLAYRVYFLNKMGYYDGISLNDSTFDTFSTESTTFESPVTEISPNPKNRLFSKLVNGFTCDWIGLTDAQQLWVKELANTVDAYESLINRPVIVQDVSGSVVKDTYSAQNQTVINFIFSQDEYSQRN
jgi:hypothetical protein